MSANTCFICSPGTKYGVTSHTRRFAAWIAPTCRRWIASQSESGPEVSTCAWTGPCAGGGIARATSPMKSRLPVAYTQSSTNTSCRARTLSPSIRRCRSR